MSKTLPSLLTRELALALGLLEANLVLALALSCLPTRVQSARNMFFSFQVRILPELPCPSAASHSYFPSRENRSRPVAGSASVPFCSHSLLETLSSLLFPVCPIFPVYLTERSGSLLRLAPFKCRGTTRPTPPSPGTLCLLLKMWSLNQQRGHH